MHVATDIGGTFTDLVAFDPATGELRVAKAETTPARLADGVLDSLDDSGVQLGGIVHLVHGSTIVINALTQRTGARTALLTTRGFRDVLAIGRGNRPDMYNLVSRKPVPFVPRRLRFEVSERVDRQGAVLVPLVVGELDAIADAMREAQVEAVAVCLLHAYAHPEHERACAAHLRVLLPTVTVTASTEITREWREYERTSTTVLNAYVQPATAGYLDDLEERLGRAGVQAGLNVMQSNAGLASAAAARRAPIYLVESGPAAGIVGAARIGELIGEPNIISLDIGGTTAKCALVQGGVVPTTTEYKIEWRPDFAGYPVLVPVVDIVEIGAGGGSIAWVDDGGALRVGPRSAGAVPGPACYGKGGESPTVTDAKLLAGVLDPAYVLGGRLHVDPQLAHEAMERLSRPLGIPAAEFANGVIRLVDANMINALKLVSVRRGHDPRDFVLVAFGGGGAMHAAALGAELRVRQIVVPPRSGVFSAWGMLLTEPRVDVVQTRVLRLGAVVPGELEQLFAGLEGEALAGLVRDAGNAAITAALTRSVDMRYAGQEHAVRVPVPLGEVAVTELEASFHAHHLQRFTFALDDTPVELVTFHVEARRRLPQPPFVAWSGGSRRPAVKGRRAVDFDVDGRHETAVYERSDLAAGFTAVGPVVVEEETTTTVVHPGQRMTVDHFGNLLLDLQ